MLICQEQSMRKDIIFNLIKICNKQLNFVKNRQTNEHSHTQSYKVLQNSLQTVKHMQNGKIYSYVLWRRNCKRLWVPWKNSGKIRNSSEITLILRFGSLTILFWFPSMIALFASASDTKAIKKLPKLSIVQNV